MGYKRDDLIVRFKGVFRTQAEHAALCAVTPSRRAYGIVMSEHGSVLDCYDDYLRGLCVASLANCHRRCYNRATRSTAVANCRLVVNLLKRTVTLRAGLSQPIRSSAKFFIPPKTELLYDYGENYTAYDAVKY